MKLPLNGEAGLGYLTEDVIEFEKCESTKHKWRWIDFQGREFYMCTNCKITEPVH